MKKEEKTNAGSLPSQVSPDLAAFMFRIEQKLAFIEKKIDALTGQVPARQFKGRENAVPISQPISQHRPEEVKSIASQGPSHGRGRRERALFKAVCAECQKDCEIPFQPTGERPVYCKECFSKRKSSRPVKALADPSPPETLSEAPRAASVSGDRKVTVTKKGVGRVVISEIAPSGTREVSSRERTQRPVKKSRA